MPEQSVSRVPSSPTAGTNDLLSRLYREIGISAVAAALGVIHLPDSQSMVAADMPATDKPAAR
jgi:hypothetical protein